MPTNGHLLSYLVTLLGSLLYASRQTSETYVPASFYLTSLFSASPPTFATGPSSSILQFRDNSAVMSLSILKIVFPLLDGGHGLLPRTFAPPYRSRCEPKSNRISVFFYSKIGGRNQEMRPGRAVNDESCMKPSSSGWEIEEDSSTNFCLRIWAVSHSVPAITQLVG